MRCLGPHSDIKLGKIYQPIGYDGLYQHIISGLIKGSYKTQLRDWGGRLIAMADHALSLRDTNKAEQISELLVNAPLLCEYQGVGQYYQALCISRRGEFTVSSRLLESLAESSAAPLKYRARALQAIGGNYYVSDKLSEALPFYIEAGHAASPKYDNDLLTATLSQWRSNCALCLYNLAGTIRAKGNERRSY